MDGIYFIFHGGMQGSRKPLEIMIRAFKAVSNPNIRLIIKSQAVRPNSEAVDIADDPRIEHIIADLATEPYRKLYTSCHVSLTPARWEGLGVHLYESLGFGMPVISNDIPPINEVISHGESGLLCKSIPDGSDSMDSRPMTRTRMIFPAALKNWLIPAAWRGDEINAGARGRI
jgi:glycosyltransferase involved in cell wall biosynthesis